MLIKKLKIFYTVLLSACLLTMTNALIAAGQEDWQYGADIYLWGAEINSEVTTTGQDIDVPFDDIIDNLDIAIMGGIGAKKGKLMLYSDFIYMDIEDSEKGSVNTTIGRHDFFTVGADVKLEVELEAWVVQPMIGYVVL